MTEKWHQHQQMWPMIKNGLTPFADLFLRHFLLIFFFCFLTRFVLRSHPLCLLSLKLHLRSFSTQVCHCLVQMWRERSSSPGLRARRQRLEVRLHVIFWSAANGGLRDGGLRNLMVSEEKGLFPPFSGFRRCSSQRPKKAEKGRNRPISADSQEGWPGTPLATICYTPMCGSRNSSSSSSSSSRLVVGGVVTFDLPMLTFDLPMLTFDLPMLTFDLPKCSFCRKKQI